MWRAVCIALYCASYSVGVWSLSDGALADFLQDAKAEEDWMVRTRRELHQWPELMYEEHNTSLYLRAALDDLKLPYQ